MYFLPIEMWRIRKLDGKNIVSIKCPNCANWSYLDHDIDSVGEVTPSLICVHDECNFHESVTLQKWNPELIKS